MANGTSGDPQVNTTVMSRYVGYGETESRLNAVFEEPETVGEFHDSD